MDHYHRDYLSHLYPLMTVVADLERPSASDAGSSDSTVQVLLKALAQNAKSQESLWDEERGHGQAFHVRIEGASYRVPARHQEGHVHSTLSPLDPSSSIYPDGLIHHAWIRKHAFEVPAILLSLHQLWDWSMLKAAGPLGGNDEVERDHDNELVKEIQERRAKILGERALEGSGYIQFAAILILKVQHMEDPGTKDRIAYVRKGAALDPKLTFVIPEGNSIQLQDYATKLQAALYETALEHYRSLSRHARRKRTRTRSGNVVNGTEVRKSSIDSSASGEYHSKPSRLAPIGWSVRAHYKSAVFAEFRQEIDAACQECGQAYLDLLEMFQDTAILAPRAKAWRDALDLADCMHYKILRSHLYMDQETLAVQVHQKHLKAFTSLLSGVGIGPDSFEYWTWHTRQKTLVAELLQAGLSNGYMAEGTNIMPFLDTVQPALSGLSPHLLLQSPGEWFMAAADSERHRKATYHAAKEHANGFSISSSAIDAESQHDHDQSVLSLLSKAYDHFKQEGRPRQISLVASQIAALYTELGRKKEAKGLYQVVIGKHRADGWADLATELFPRLQDLHPVLSKEEMDKLQLDQLFSQARPDNVIVDALSAMDISDETLYDMSGNDMIRGLALFDSEVVTRGNKIVLQIVLQSSFSLLPQTIQIGFLQSRQPLVVHHLTHNEVPDFLDASSQETMRGNLQIICGRALILRFVLRIEPLDALEVDSIKLAINEKLSLVVRPTVKPSSFSDPVSVPIEASRRVSVRAKTSRIRLSVVHCGLAYTKEIYPLIVKVTNLDRDAVSVSIDLTAAQDIVNEGRSHDVALSRKAYESESTRTMLRIEGRSSEQQVLYLHSASPGRRQLEASISYRVTTKEFSTPKPSESESLEDSVDLVESLFLPVIDPFSVNFDISFHPEMPEDSDNMDASSWLAIYSVVCRLKCESNDELVLHGLDPVTGNTGVKIVSLPPTLTQPQKMEPGGVYLSRFTLRLPSSTRRDDVRMTVKWSRASPLFLPVTPYTAELACEAFDVPSALAFATIRTPAHLAVHEKVELAVQVANPTEKVIDGVITIDPAGLDGFAYAGPRLKNIVLLPEQVVKVRMTMVPIFTGWCRLPTVGVTDERTGEPLRVTRSLDHSGTSTRYGPRPQIASEEPYDRWIFVRA